jgi:putative addiction module killer protein/probable addiction module antidote protein
MVFAPFLSHKTLIYPSTYQNKEIVNKAKDG